MTGTVLERSLKMVAGRLHKLRVLRRQALCWVLLLAPAMVLALKLPQLQGFISTNLLVLLGVTIAGIALARWRMPAPTALETARLVEKNRPELNDAVLTAVQADERSRGQSHSSILNEWVIDEADKLARASDWKSVVPRRQMFVWSTLSFLSFCFLVSGVVAAGRWGRELDGPVFLFPTGEAAGPTEIVGRTELSVDPGDIEIERGTALTVVARFGRVLPTNVVLQLNTDEGAATFTMEPTVDEGVFAARVNSIDSDSTYRVFFGNSVAELSRLDTPEFRNKSESYKVSTYVRPRLDQVDALITPPAYTGKPEQLIEDTLRVTVVEGSAVQLLLHLNKSVAIAELHADDDTVIPLVSVEPDSGQVVATLEAFENQKFRVYLEDEDGRTAAEEETISLRVTRNKRPKIKITFPGRDTNVSPLQELQIEAKATDDFGFSDFGVMYSLTSGSPVELSLADTLPDQPDDIESSKNADDKAQHPTAGSGKRNTAAKKIQLQHMIDMEQLNAAPDELLSYYFYVEDLAADGSQRRTYSDMMFAEVRRFEEIFHESEQQSQQQQQQQQQGNKTEELLQLQRQIMVATWNIQRSIDESRSRENATAKAVEDADVVLQSQQQAMEQLLEAKEKASEDPDTLKLVEDVEVNMKKTVDQLVLFREQKKDAQLADALFAEQSAFAGLMRLRAKEHEVSRSQSQKGQGKRKQNSASQQQLRQLELDNDRNRYESERQAQQQQEQNDEQREQLQILNRLKELSRRQQMLNERLKQLESELRAAQAKEEKEEIERELKRLREEQREMLRDVDELRETMDQQSAEQQQQNQETREQVEQARERVQQASQAMDASNLSKAISEGTRAERQFDQLQEEFRKQTSNQFTEAMRDLRQQTRGMTERQKQISRELSGDSTPEEDQSAGQRPSLRGDRDRENVQEKVARQRDDLERVLEQAKQIVEEAEESEPLLSRRLYDTVRDTREKKPQEALEATEILVSRGLWNQSQQAEQIARKGIEDLAEGIEQAADAVLGSEAESLRRAEQEIEDLANQLSSEIADATGQNPNGEPSEDQPNATPGQQGAQREGQTDNESSPQRQGIQRAAAPLPNEQQRQANGGSQSQQQDKQESQRAAAAGQSEQQQQKGEEQSGQRQPGDGQQQEESPPQQGKQPEQEGQGQQPGPGKPQDGQKPGKGQPSPQSGEQPGQGQQPGQSEQQGQQPGQNQSGNRQSGRSGQDSFLLNGGRQTNGGRGATQQRPLTGDEFRDWSNRLREVEEVLDDPELRNQVAQVRDRARSIRAEFKRHGKEPQWDLVKSQLLDEMKILQKRLNQELSKLESDRSMVPIDREPVPEEFDELVRRYYELLGQSREEEK
ncbi:MAG: hypothetical protein P8J37_11180 [Fuerstiella sp.]|nr:hypothetical protein [Fuerstiella sp.]